MSVSCTLFSTLTTVLGIVVWSLSHVQLFCDPMDYSPLGFSAHGISQARILEQVVISWSRDLPDPGIKPASNTLQVDSLPLSHWGSPPDRHYYAHFTAEEIGSEWLSNLRKVTKPSTVNQEFESRSFALKTPDLSTFSLCPDQLCLQKGEGRSFPVPFTLLCFPLSEPRCSASLSHSAVYLCMCSKG